MSEQQRGGPAGPEMKFPDPMEMTRAMVSIAERSQKLVGEWLQRQGKDQSVPGPVDPLNVGRAFLEMTTRLMSDPAKLMQAQLGLWQDYMRLWQSTTMRLWGMDGAQQKVAEPAAGDRRFNDPALEENALLDFIK